MSSPDSSNDFSHLPTVDESHSVPGGDAAGLWEKHRRAEGPKPAEVRPNPPPRVESAPSEVAAPRAEDWQALLEMETEDPLMEYRRPAPAPPLPPAPAKPARAKTVIRAPNRPAAAPEPLHEEPAAAPEPEPVLSEEPRAKAPEVQARERTDPAPKPSKRENKAAKEADAVEDDAAAAPAEKPKPAVTVELAAAPKSPWRHRLEKMGGRALGLSVAIHLVIIGSAALYVVNRTMERQVDFLPGGGTPQSQAASQALQNKIQQKKNPWLKKSMPIRRLASMDKISEISLPDAPDTFELPDVSNQLLNSKLGAGMGLGGAGGGFGNGMGLGSRSGMVFQPLSMFGRQINARKMALILDVSSSMAPHLPRVIAEVDKIAKDSVVVLYVGCGLEPPPPRGLDGEEVYRTSGQEFERFWRMGGATLEESRKVKINPQDPIPMESVFRLLSRRPQTYFIHSVGLSYTWLALLSNEVRSADALYWFSDFQDTVNFKQLGIVRENLMNRKQKLYIHAYQRGSAFDLVVSQLVEPTNGDVIEADE